MTRRVRLKAAIFGGMLGFVLALIPAGALAEVNSAWNDFTTYGQPYKNKSRFIYASNDIGVGEIRQRNTAAVPQGWIGAKPRVYFQGNEMCSSVQMTYSTFPSATWSNSFSHGCGGRIYSKGITDTWNGSGYNSNSALATDIILR